jgi:hypothetical protein
MPFQTQVNGLPSPGIEGDFADFNPRFTALAGPGGLVAGSAGVAVGKFCWFSQQNIDPDNAATIVNSFGYGVIPDGLVPRPGQQGIITTFLADSTMTINQGLPVWVMTGGGLWVKNNGSGLATVGQKAYATFNNGTVTFAATGSPTQASLTTSSIAAATSISCTGSISGNVLTVTAIATGSIYPGAILTGSNVATGTQVVAQLSGTAQGIGTYALNIAEQTVASETISGTYGVLTVGAGTPIQGGILSGSGGGGVTAGTVVWQQLTASTWVVSPSQSVTSSTITENTNIETKWYARSSGGVGELVKISEVVQ